MRDGSPGPNHLKRACVSIGEHGEGPSHFDHFLGVHLGMESQGGPVERADGIDSEGSVGQTRSLVAASLSMGFAILVALMVAAVLARGG